MTRQSGSVLVGVLWCLVLLVLVVVGVLHSARMDLLVARNYGDRIQARYLALAGIEKAKALLYQDSRDRRRGRQNHNGSLEDAPQHFQAVTLGRGEFHVFHARPQADGGGIVYGVTDEESRLNLNHAQAEDFAKIEEMTPEVVAAIVDWRDGDNEVTAGGAEIDYYASMEPPRRPRNGEFLSVGELQMVRGVSRDLLWGIENGAGGDEDARGAGESGEGAEDEDLWVEPEGGWAALLTVHSLVQNSNASGESRVNVKSADEAALTGVRGITPDIARAIMAYRGQRPFENLLDLLDVRAVQQGGASAAGPPQPAVPQGGGPASAALPVVPGSPPVLMPGQGPVPGAQGGNQGGNQGANLVGPPLISEDLFLEIADDVTVDDQTSQAGAININTASQEVLECLPGVSRELAYAIVAQRRSGGFYPNVASLLRVPGMTREVLKPVFGRLCARSETFRVLAEGRIRSSRVRQRVEAVVRLGSQGVETIAYREEMP